MKNTKTAEEVPVQIARRREQSDFGAISLKLASPEKIREWSFGEVTKPETINYRTQRSERGGLFDERIFGPEKDYECYCGKYRRIRYKNIVCEKCGVEVTRSIVRRERMGHIELASPVAHIWFLRGIPSRIGMLLNVSLTDLEKVIYFAGHIVMSVHEGERARMLEELDREYKSKIKSIKTAEDKDHIKDQLSQVKKEIEGIRVGLVLDEANYHHYVLKYGSVFEAGIGAEALFNLSKRLNFEELKVELAKTLETASSTEKPKVRRRLNLIKTMLRAGVKPEWMFLSVIPVIPPALRPMVPLDGGRHATSDINDLYRRVINRNNRLKKLVLLHAPDVILRNEKRILQEAVDALIDNSIRRGSEGAMNQSQRRPLKSIADMLKGKQGRFRQNLLGKRVDYSGRSVIVVGPDLRLNQCGLPKHMALELFKPFVISKLLERELAFNIRGANRLIDEGIPDVWVILEKVIKDKYVLLNRAPTLHRLGIQAFKPILIEGNAIQIHPLVCTAFNADFDGDQMAVHVPLSYEAQREAKMLLAANTNLLKPGNGDPIVNPKLDMVLGCYWMTKVVALEKGEGKYFQSPNSAINAYDFGHVGFRALIKVMGTDKQKYAEFGGGVFETSVGRILFNSILPEDFPYINAPVTMKEITGLIENLIIRYGIGNITSVLDKIKDFGFRYAMRSGVTWGIDDLPVIPEKPAIIEAAVDKVRGIEGNFENGLLSEDERYRMVIEVWSAAKNEIEELIPGALNPNGSVHDLLISKARGSITNLSQMTGMKGLIQNTASQTIDFPIIPSYREGLSPLEYFITTHGSRKGLADTALQTAKAGYLTRKMVDVAQDIIVLLEDCGDREGRLYSKDDISGFDTGIASNVDGRVLAKPIVDEGGKTLFPRGHLLSKRDAKELEALGITEAHVRSPITCRAERGVCRRCYGLDLGRNKLVEIGEAVGIVAAQAIGEPGTQLTMRTFHTGGVASASGDITMGLPRVEEIFEARTPKYGALIALEAGVVTEIKTDGLDKILMVAEVETKSKKKKDKVAEYRCFYPRALYPKVGAEIKKGDVLSDGPVDLEDLFELGGRRKAENYILNEVSEIYELFGASIARKHIEVIIKKMFSRFKVTDAGETKFVEGEIVDLEVLSEENDITTRAGGTIAKAEVVLRGISDVALSTTSFLSSASFQNTTKVLIESAVSGKIDRLKGLKENVIVGRLVPAGTGLTRSYFGVLEDEIVFSTEVPSPEKEKKEES